MKEKHFIEIIKDYIVIKKNSLRGFIDGDIAGKGHYLCQKKASFYKNYKKYFGVLRLFNPNCL